MPAEKKAGPKGPAPKVAAATSGDVAGGGFDPFAATFEEAQQRQALAGEPRPSGPLFQWFEAQRLTASRASVEKGTGFDVLEAVAGCALHGLAMPEWLAMAYLKRYRHVQMLHGDSWDAEAAFGKPYPAKSQVGAMRRRRLQRVKVWNIVAEFVKRQPETPIDALWQRFGAGHASAAEASSVPTDIAQMVREVGCSKSTAQELYREACERLSLPDHRAIRARLLPASSAQVAGRRKKT